MKIMFLGDTHCSRTAVSVATDYAERFGIDRIFQVGDFGFWPMTNNGIDFIEQCHYNRLPLYWMPGNHEDWPSYYDFLDNAVYDDDGFAIHGAMRVAPPTHAWNWDGLRFGSLGGAYSVDRSVRTEGVSWFPEELPQYEWVDQLPEQVDVLVTHEAPINLSKAHGWGPLPKSFKVDWDLSVQSQDVVRRAIEKTHPQVAIHGHWHFRIDYNIAASPTHIFGIDQASGEPIHQASIVLDTEKRAVYNWNQFIYEGDPLCQLN